MAFMNDLESIHMANFGYIKPSFNSIDLYTVVLFHKYIGIRKCDININDITLLLRKIRHQFMEELSLNDNFGLHLDIATGIAKVDKETGMKYLYEFGKEDLLHLICKATEQYEDKSCLDSFYLFQGLKIYDWLLEEISFRIETEKIKEEYNNLKG